MGSRAVTTASCAALASARGLVCTSTPALLSYPSDFVSSFATTYAFSTTRAVVNPTRSAVVAESWTNFLAGNFANTLNDTGVVTPPNFVWTGWNDVNTCNGWTSSGTAMGAAGWSDQMGVGMVDFNSYFCSTPFRVVCVCVE